MSCQITNNTNRKCICSINNCNINRYGEYTLFYIFCVIITIIAYIILLFINTDPNNNTNCSSYKTYSECFKHKYPCDIRDMQININGTIVNGIECYNTNKGIIMAIVIPSTIFIVVTIGYIGFMILECIRNRKINGIVNIIRTYGNSMQPNNVPNL